LSAAPHQGDFPEIGIVMITAFGDVETAVTAMKNGAYDFVSKPINLDQLLMVIRKGSRASA
jgi:two-component system nitrogen regulation response regulator NtrX